MNIYKVTEIYLWIAKHNIDIWIDGGWCIDALIGRQTRDHSDLDIAVHRRDNDRLYELLKIKGYKEEKREDSTEYMYVMRDEENNFIDVHVFEYDINGKNIYGVEYPYGSLTGNGIINNCEVKCINSRFMFEFKIGYEAREKDIIDLKALNKKFGYELPDKYKI